MEDKSLKDYLINLEDNVNKKVTNLSEVCGEPIENYLKGADYYVFEPFDQKLKDYKKSQFIIIFIQIILCLLSLVSSFFLKNPFLIFGIVFSIFLIVILIINFLMIFKQKTKMNVKSWNSLAKYDFYFSTDHYGIKKEKSGNGSNLSLILSIFKLFICVGLVINSVINGFADLIGPIMCISSIFVLCIFILISFKTTYDYPTIIIDKSDSYLIWSCNSIKKVNKK